MILELQNAILEMIATGEPLATTISELCLKVEAAIPDVTASVLTFDGTCLHTLAAPSLPAEYSLAIDNLVAGPLAGSCGTAAYYGTSIAVTDIQSDPRWQDFKSLVLSLGYKACWSSPIKSGERVIGTFAFYYRDRRGPSALDQKVVDACVHLCSIAIDREERVRERQRLTYTDALTGLPNRARFDLLLREDVPQSDGRWGLLLADIDNLKLVNDTFGHAAGDALIQIVSDRVKAVAGEGCAFRLGGDEFAVFVADGQGLEYVARDILAGLSSPSTCDGHVMFPVATIGGAVAEAGSQPDQTRQNADIALYHAKEQCRGQYFRFIPVWARH